MIKKFQNYFFQEIHGNNLVYNTCWEDPRCDRELLELNNDSEIVMITSAGCNALAYLLDNPKNVYCIDMNSRQNALLELKKSFFISSDFKALFKCFGEGRLSNVKSFYKAHLRLKLPAFAQVYWDKHIDYFDGKGVRKSFYFHGTSGLLAYLVKNYLKTKKKLNHSIDQFFQSVTLEQQAAIYTKFEAQFWSKLMARLMNQHVIMSLAGVPKSQQQLFTTRYENGAVGFMRDCMTQVFTQVPVKDNYFWQLYYNGQYTNNCCPDYLKEENFDNLSSKVDRLSTHTTTISDFLKEHPGEYSHYVLLDHQDWLADNDVEALREEWELILKNSKKGTRILLRSAAKNVDFFPDFVLDKITFQEELASEVHLKDRVGTYASTYLGIVK